jgi:protein gp37
MLAANWHTYQILTKRADRMAALLQGKLRKAAKAAHIWWGVSVENKKHGLLRVAELQRSPAAIRFLSIEPLLEDLGLIDLSGISWVIVGGESGHGARRLDQEWVRSIRDQCAQADVAFFFKQWGGVQKKKNGRMLNDRTFDDRPPIVVIREKTDTPAQVGRASRARHSPCSNFREWSLA